MIIILIVLGYFLAGFLGAGVLHGIDKALARDPQRLDEGDVFVACLLGYLTFLYAIGVLIVGGVSMLTHAFMKKL